MLSGKHGTGAGQVANKGNAWRTAERQPGADRRSMPKGVDQVHRSTTQPAAQGQACAQLQWIGGRPPHGPGSHVGASFPQPGHIEGFVGGHQKTHLDPAVAQRRQPGVVTAALAGGRAADKRDPHGGRLRASLRALEPAIVRRLVPIGPQGLSRAQAPV